MTLPEAKAELEKFVKLKTTLRPAFVDVLLQAKEVKRGRWHKISISDAHGNYAVVQCTACKALYGLQTHYCPNCGAQMDLDNEVAE